MIAKEKMVNKKGIVSLSRVDRWSLTISVVAVVTTIFVSVITATWYIGQEFKQLQLQIGKVNERVSTIEERSARNEDINGMNQELMRRIIEIQLDQR